MRWLYFWLVGIAVAGCLPAVAQDSVVQEFSGSGSTTTGLFKVQDRWEVRWNARQVVSVAVMSSDGTIVAGASGVLRGSLFVPLGGQYYFKISDGTVAPVPATASGTNAPPVAGSTNSVPVAAGTNAPPAAGSTNAAPAAGGTNSAPPPPAATDSAPPPSPEPMASWHLQVVELGKSVPADQELTVYTPFFMVPDSAVAPVAAPVDLPPPVLTGEQARAMVTIQGDNAQGTGFLMKSPDGTFVVTQIHLLAGNPNVKILTNSGAAITTLSLKGAVDRDLALFTVQDANYSYLPLATDAATSVQAGDQVLIPDIGQQAGSLLGKPGRVIGLAPDRIDFDNALSPGGSGAPVIHVKSGKVLAVVASQNQVDVSDYLAKAWPGNPAPGSAGIIPYSGLPLYGVRGWETYDAARFLAETSFLKQFHQDTLCLDSYLNGRRHRERYAGDNTGPPDNRYFLNNTKLREANESYKQFASGADVDQQTEAANELLFDLEGVADTGLSTLQAGNYLYTYDQNWAQKELAYRRALKKELDDLSNNLGRLKDIARAR